MLAALSNANWLVRLHGYASSSTLIGVIVIAGLPSPPPMVSSFSWLAYFAAVQGRLCFHHHSTSSIADWLCRQRLMFLSSQLRVVATGLLLLPPTRVHFITAIQVVLQFSRLLLGHPQHISSLKQWLLDDKKLQFSTLYSVVSQLTKESGATQIQDSKSDKFNVKMKQSINQPMSHYLRLRFRVSFLLHQL